MDEDLRLKLKLLNESPAIQRTIGMSVAEIEALPEEEKAAIRKAVEDAIKKANELQKEAS